MSLSIPYTFVGGVGNKAKASEVNANFAAVAAKFVQGVGGISDDDVSTTAAIKGSKLSSTLGSRVPTDRLELEAVTDIILANDTAIPGFDTGRAVGGEHIKTLTAAQMARFLPNSPTAGIGKNKLKLTVHVVPFSFSAIGRGATEVQQITEASVNPSVAFPKATYDLIGLFIKNSTLATILLSATAGDNAGANWYGRVRAIHADAASLTAAGDLVYVFLELI